MSQNYTPPPVAGTPPPNYLVPAIISICCWPLAIPAIIFSVQVNKRFAAGDIAGAEDASKKAKMFAYIGIGVGLAWWIIIIVLNVFFGVMAGLMGSR
jgi:Interferon-induced transmembrane protein